MFLFFIPILFVFAEIRNCLFSIKSYMNNDNLSIHKKHVLSKFKIILGLNIRYIYQVISKTNMNHKFIYLKEDLLESQYSSYIQDMSGSILEDYSNERICFTQLLGNYSQNLPSVKYHVNRGKY